MIFFIDTSAIVALLWASDANHAAAVATWKALLDQGARPMTTDLVLAETVILTRVRAGFDLSVDAGERLRMPPFEMVWADRVIVDEAWKIYKKYSDHELSLCDCVSFAVMKRRKIDVAFEFDGDFEALGFRAARPD